MKVFFCSTMFADFEKNFKKSKKLQTLAGHIFQENLLFGLQENKVDISVINIPRVKYYPYYVEPVLKTTPFSANGIRCGITVGTINLRWLNNITAGIQVFRYAWRAIRVSGDEPILFLVFNTHLPQTPVLLLLKRLFPKITLCDVIGDLHGNYGVTVQLKGLHGKMVRWLGELSNKMARHFDCFGLLTAEMAKAIDVTDKPYIVIEGFYRKKESEAVEKATDDKEKVVFYAGYLAPDYGIEHMLRAFGLIENRNYRLVLAGYGEDSAIMQRYAEKDDRIKFLGLITPEEVGKWQGKSTALISPRTTEHEFVKYSFPSKTLECLASGKPYIAHRLPCDPPEYADYIQYARDESDEALRDKIVEICEMLPEERRAIGNRAREFVLREKNPRVMCGHITKMWEKLCH